MWSNKGWTLCCLCLVVGSVLSAAEAETPSVVHNQGENRTTGMGAVVPSKPNSNLAVFEASPRLYHRKGEELVRATGKDCRTCHDPAYYPQKDFFGWEHQKKWRLHWALFSVSVFVMLCGLCSAVLLWQRGRRPSLHHPVHWPSVFGGLFREAILGERVGGQDRLRWAIFMLISVAFLALAAVFGLTLLTRFVLPAGNPFVFKGALFLDLAADLLGGCILVGILLALYRRARGREPHLETEAEDFAILLLLLAIVVTGFFLESCRLVVVAREPETWASFLGAAGARVLNVWELPWTALRFYGWILHAALVFCFLAYLPFSKLFHIITSPVSIAASASERHYKQRQ